jgi:hypothetical protein
MWDSFHPYSVNDLAWNGLYSTCDHPLFSSSCLLEFPDLQLWCLGSLEFIAIILLLAFDLEKNYLYFSRKNDYLL